MNDIKQTSRKNINSNEETRSYTLPTTNAKPPMPQVKPPKKQQK